MRKIYQTGFFFLIMAIIFSLAPNLWSAPPGNVSNLNAQDYSGPIQLTWNAVTATPAVDYYIIYRATTNFTYAQRNDAVAVPSLTSLRMATTTYLDTQTEDKKNYFYYVTAVNADGESAAFSNLVMITANYAKLQIALSVDVLDSNIDYLLDYDSQTARISYVVSGVNGMPGIAEKIVFNISYYGPNTSIWPGPLELSGTSGSFTWGGTWAIQGHGGHKHNGWYTIEATPTGYDGKVGLKGYASLAVDVVHHNTGRGIVYRTVGTDVTYGPPFKLDYYLSKSAFVSWKIYDRMQTATTADDVLIKTINSDVPRVDGDQNSYTLDSLVNIETWNGRDENGKIVANDIYRCTFQAWEFWNQSGENFVSATTDRSLTVEGLIAFDVLRIVDYKVTAITPTNALAQISYYLAGADDEKGGASVKIMIAKGDTRFTMATTSGTVTYLGNNTYNYVAGDPLPHDAANLTTIDASKIIKLFSFARESGQHTESWDGKDGNGASVTNGNYLFTLSATDDSGNHAIDNSGDDRIIQGNITIDRTVSQTPGDTTAPSVVSVTPANGTIVTAPLSQISVTLSDSGGAGVDLTNTTLTLSDPSGNSVSGTKSNNGSNTITLTFSTPFTTNGSYTIRCTPRDTAGNIGSDYTTTFSLSITVAGVETSFKDSVYAYPNPAKSVPARIAYRLINAAKITVEIFNILGDRVWKQEFNSAAGNQIYNWNLINDDNEKIGSGVYIYRLKADDGTSNFEVTKKLIVIQ